LERHAPKAADILRTWYENYKGPGIVTCQPPSDERDAARYIEDAAQRHLSDKRQGTTR
jgi:hypothetical protein